MAANNGDVQDQEPEKNLSPAYEFAEKLTADGKISFRCKVKKADSTNCGKLYAVSVNFVPYVVLARSARVGAEGNL